MKKHLLWVLVLVLVVITRQLAAEIVDPRNFIIENVYIASETAENVLSNLLIRNNRFEALTKDDVTVPKGLVALDANGGYLVGNLAIRKPPSFMTLDKGPRIDFDALLNHESHSTCGLSPKTL